jgi:pyruvate formate lyase activating enzyme
MIAITHLQRMSLHDGAGIRSTIFFKGCNMHCQWCHNPETFSPLLELGWLKTKCIGCGVCLEKCPQGALSAAGDEIVRNHRLCSGCNTCIEECYPQAHHRIGTETTVEELCKQMEEDRRIFENSGGGVTLSGGEPMVQFPFLLGLAKALSEKGFHITLQTNLNTAWDKYQAILPYVNYWMCDLKLLDAEAHRYWTGADNRLIRENIRHLDASGASYCLRTPVIPGVNSNDEQLQQMSDFASGLQHLDYYELLPFHPLASYKYKDLGMEYAFETVKEIPATEFAELKKKFEIRNIVII